MAEVCSRIHWFDDVMATTGRRPRREAPTTEHVPSDRATPPVDRDEAVTPWYVVRCKPAKEFMVTSVLVQRGVSAYLPLLRKRTPRAGRRDWEPLFPGYVFASLEIPSDTWLMARSAPDVAYFLGRPDRPTALPDGFVPALMARLDPDDPTDPPPRFRPGERVVITQGQFQWVETVFDRKLWPNGRSRVLLQLLHRLVPLDLPEAHLRNAG